MAGDPQAELEALARSARDARQVVRVLLTGPEGMGRSHLLQQLARGSWGQTVVVSAEGQHTARRVLEALVELPALPEEALARLAALPHLVALDDTRRRLAAELLLSLREARPSGTLAARLDADARHDSAAMELARWLAALAPSGLLLACDDVHRAGPQTLHFLEAVAQLEGELPVLLVFTSDSQPVASLPQPTERLEAWRSSGRFKLLSLPPWELPALKALLAQQGAGPAEAELLADAAKGSPGVALGLTSLVWAHPTTHQQLPQGARALRLARLRALGEGPYEAARTGAALGDAFPQEVLYAALEGAEESVDVLVRAGVLRESVEARMPVLSFGDWRDRALLKGTTAADRNRTRAGLFCARMLDLFTPDLFNALQELVLPLALPALTAPTASLWREAQAAVLSSRGEVEEAIAAAAQHAQGIRKLVLTRRLADLQLTAGKPEQALATLAAAARVNPSASPLPEGAVGEVLEAQARPPLDSWETLGGAEAQAAFALSKAEALAQLVKTEDTVKAYEDARRRLEALQGPLAASLWVRWARGWSWFGSEILGKAQEAVKACEDVRRRVGAALQSDADALGFLRAEQVACSSAGDFARGRELVEEQIALAERRGEVRDQCLGWNARAILHFGQGELFDAQRSFQRSYELARATGWTRREAIALHNLALVQCERGELDAAHRSESEYAVLSERIGNHAGRAEAPLVLASVALARERYDVAKSLIAQARQAAESNEWAMLEAWARALMGRSLLAQAVVRKDMLELAKARNELAASLERLEETTTAWHEELDPGEVYALLAVGQVRAGNLDAALQTLERGEQKLPAQAVVSQRSLALGQAYVENRLPEALEWFEAKGYVRLVSLWKKLAPPSP